MRREKEFKAQQKAISDQVQVVLQARLTAKEAEDDFEIARSAETRASNARSNAKSELNKAQEDLAGLLKEPPTT